MLIRVHDSHNRAIRRRVFAFERKACFLSATPKNQFTDAGACGVNRYHWFALRLEILIKGLNHHQLAMVQRFVLDCGYDSANYSCELHLFVQCPMSNVPMSIVKKRKV